MAAVPRKASESHRRAKHHGRYAGNANTRVVLVISISYG